jgi:hypothetical protein
LVTIGLYAAIAVLASAAIAAVRLLFKPEVRQRPPIMYFLFLQLCVDCALVLLVLAHRFTGMVYPAGRTGLHLVFCLTLLCITMAGLVHRNSRGYYTAVAAAGLLSIRFATQLSFSHYASWRYDASSRPIFDDIRKLSPPLPVWRSKISCTWIYAPAL